MLWVVVLAAVEWHFLVSVNQVLLRVAVLEGLHQKQYFYERVHHLLLRLALAVLDNHLMQTVIQVATQ
jgi:hypothetical protein